MTRLQDDFYHAINGEWEKTAVIPDDKPRTGGFSDLADEIEDLMLETTDQWLAGENVPIRCISRLYECSIKCPLGSSAKYYFT